MLTDLDELLLSVRDPDSRTYIREAIIAYRGGALRAAVVSTWVAVIYDIISKLRILESQNDAAAHKLIEELDGAVKSNSVKAMTAFEEKLPIEALKTFEFISLSESRDIERLRDDRNRCAHPAFGGDMLLYNPSPESVRAHIVHAIRHLLSRPPVQGKAAIERMLDDITGPLFPTYQLEADKFLNAKYLDHAKDSLVRNVINILVKDLIHRPATSRIHGHESAALVALVAVSHRHPQQYQACMRELLVRHGTSVEDGNIGNLLALVAADSTLWDLLSEPARIKINKAVDRYTPASVSDDVLDAA